MIDLENVRNAIRAFDASWSQMTKFAMVPAPGGPPPQAMPPDQGGPPPPPPGPEQGGPPPGPEQGGPPPGPPPGPEQGGPPPPPGPEQGGPPPGPEQGGMPPEAEMALSQLADGMQQVAPTVEQQQQQTAQMGKRMLELEQRLDEKEREDKMKESAPFEGSTRTGKSISLKSLAGL